MTTIGETLDASKKYQWYVGGKDSGIKAADKVEDKVTGDAYDYKGTSKAGVDASRLHGNLHDLGELLFSALPIGHTLEGVKGGLELLHTFEGLVQDVSSGAKTIEEAAVIFTGELGKFAVEHGLKFNPATVALLMGKAVMMSVPKMFEAQKQDEQLMHDEGIELMVGKHFGDQMPEVTYAKPDAGMSTFGQTFKKTPTFEKVSGDYETALKLHPEVSADMQKRFTAGKTAVLDLGIKSKSDLDKLLDPSNTSPKAVAFREVYNEKTNVSFRYGVRAMIDEQASPPGTKGAELCQKDVAKYQADKAALDAKAVPVKS